MRWQSTYEYLYHSSLPLDARVRGHAAELGNSTCTCTRSVSAEVSFSIYLILIEALLHVEPEGFPQWRPFSNPSVSLIAEPEHSRHSLSTAQPEAGTTAT